MTHLFILDHFHNRPVHNRQELHGEFITGEIIKTTLDATHDSTNVTRSHHCGVIKNDFYIKLIRWKPS